MHAKWSHCEDTDIVSQLVLRVKARKKQASYSEQVQPSNNMSYQKTIKTQQNNEKISYS